MGTGSRVRAWRRGVVASIALFIVLSGPSAAVAAGPPPEKSVRAFLDGRPLKLDEVSDWYCDDFSYPVINCYSDPEAQQAESATILAATGITYVTIYDYANFAGSYMQVSQDYSALFFIGWNDKISSLKARNGLEANFYTDWFYSGTGYYVCCNQWFYTLGAYDNTFSSVIQI